METNINEWKVFESDTGNVYRAISRDEAVRLQNNGLVMVSKPGAPYLRRFQPLVSYDDDTIFWKLILSAWGRQYTDWKKDYERKYGTGDELPGEQNESNEPPTGRKETK